MNPHEVMLQQPPKDIEHLRDLYRWTVQHPRDLDKNLHWLKNYGSLCKHITEFSIRRESTLGLLAGAPEYLVSYNLEVDHEFQDRLTSLIDIFPHTKQVTIDARDSLNISEIAETDLLYIDTYHTSIRLLAELRQHAEKVKRFIIVHRTNVYGHKGESGEWGLLHGIAEWCEAYPEWQPVMHTAVQSGLTVISRNKRDHPEKPMVLVDPGYGPGTEMKQLLKSVGVTSKPGCHCERLMGQMNILGPVGCEREFETLVVDMKKNQEKFGWTDHLAAAAQAFKTGLAFKISWVDPLPSLFREAIRRSRRKDA